MRYVLHRNSSSYFIKESFLLPMHTHAVCVQSPHVCTDSDSQRPGRHLSVVLRLHCVVLSSCTVSVLGSGSRRFVDWRGSSCLPRRHVRRHERLSRTCRESGTLGA